MIDGLDGFIFSLHGATLDQSYTTTSPMVKFPAGYLASNTEADRNMWRGVAISQAEVVLPGYLSQGTQVDETGNKTDAKAEPIELTLSNVLIDGDGFTCNAEAQNVISEGALDPDSWDLSINDFYINILKNDISGVGFGGKVNVPPLGESSKLDYSAKYNIETKGLQLDASLPKDAEFPMLSGALAITGGNVTLAIEDSKVKPSMDIDGKLSVNAAIGSKLSDSKLSLPDIEFQRMHISPDRFSLGSIGVVGKISTPDVAGFQLTIDKINSFEEDNGASMGLSFDAEVHITDKFGGMAGIKLYGDAKKWKYNKVSIDKIQIDYEQAAFTLAGGVEFKNGDYTYGNGFRGDIKMKLLKGKLEVDAVAVFGKKDNYRYFLTDAFLEVEPASGVKVSFLNFYGVGGGLYFKMQQESGKPTSDFGKSLSGINYVPDDNVGIGLMARTKFGFVGNDKTMDADVGLEIQFNKDWGLNFIQFRGDATFICKDLGPKVSQSITSNMDKIKLSSKGVEEFKAEQLEEPDNDGMLRASMGMMFDIQHDIFSADLKAYLNVGGFLRGSGPADRLGFASIRIAPDEWYTRIGTPDDRCGVEILDLASASSYFMVGSNVPELPSPPDKILNSKLLTQEQKNYLKTRSDGDKLLSGSGVAFGTSLDVNLNATLTPFYASLGVGMGSEFLLKHYSEGVHCKGSEGPVGINGWYAQAQAWAWVDTKIGMKVKLFGKTSSYNIISASMASYLKGAGPKPFYFTGVVGGEFNVLNGLVKGKCSFDFEVGDKCELVGGSPFGEDVIAQLTPSSGDKDVNVFIAPQLVLNVPANTEMKLDDGCTYKVCIDEFTITNEETNHTLEAKANPSSDGRTYTYKLTEPLESQKKHKVSAKVSFKKKSGNTWVNVKDDKGKDCIETKTAEFTSGERPKYIMPEHVLYSYPADRQYNFYSKEHDKVYILTSQNYRYLFEEEKPAGYDQVLQLTAFNGTTQTAAIKHTNTPADVTDSNVRFEVSADISGLTLKPDEIYTIAIINKPQKTVAQFDTNIDSTTTAVADNAKFDMQKTTRHAEGNMEVLDVTEIYSAHFRTSSYSTFSEKMDGFVVNKYVGWQVAGTIFELIANLTDKTAKPEILDRFEYNYNNEGNNLVVLTPDYSNTKWYTNEIVPLLYGNSDAKAVLGNMEPPKNISVATIVFTENNRAMTDNEVEKGSFNSRYYSGAYNNNISERIYEEYYEAKTDLANYALSHTTNQGIDKLLTSNYLPILTKGIYPILAKYKLPGKNHITHTKQINIEY